MPPPTRPSPTDNGGPAVQEPKLSNGGLNVRLSTLSKEDPLAGIPRRIDSICWNYAAKPTTSQQQIANKLTDAAPFVDLRRAVAKLEKKATVGTMAKFLTRKVEEPETSTRSSSILSSSSEKVHNHTLVEGPNQAKPRQQITNRLTDAAPFVDLRKEVAKMEKKATVGTMAKFLTRKVEKPENPTRSSSTSSSPSDAQSQQPEVEDEVITVDDDDLIHSEGKEAWIDTDVMIEFLKMRAEENKESFRRSRKSTPKVKKPGLKERLEEWRGKKTWDGGKMVGIRGPPNLGLHLHRIS